MMSSIVNGTGEDMAADEPAGIGNGTAVGGIEEVAEGSTTNWVLLNNRGNVYIPPFPVGLADDEDDDASRRKERRGIEQ